MSTLDLRYYNQSTSQWEAPLANGVDLDAVALLLEQHKQSDNPHGITKASVGLGDVDNTSDTDKPISTATQQALSNISGSVEQLDTKVTQHLDENSTLFRIYARDNSLGGILSVSTPAQNVAPYKIEIRASMLDVTNAVFSIGSWEANGNHQTCVSLYKSTNGNIVSGNASATVQAAINENNYTNGLVKNVSKNGFDIEWFKNGNPSGAVQLQIIAYYHGGVGNV